MKTAVMAVIVLFSGLAFAAEQNFLINGNFGSLNQKKQPNLWSIRAKNPTVSGEKGQYSLEAVSITSGKNNLVSISQMVNNLPAGVYQLTGEFKGKAQKLYLVMFHHIEGVKQGNVQLSSCKPAGTDAWQSFTLTSKVPDGKKRTSVTVQAICSEPGLQIGFRNLKLIRKEESGAGADKKTVPADSNKKAAPAAPQTGAKPAPAAAEKNITASLVARPAAASGVVWPKHSFCGKEWWLCLHPAWRKTGDLAKESFIQNAGWNHVGLPWVEPPPLRITGITEIEVYQKGKNVAAATGFKFSSPEEKTRFVRMQNISDGDLKSCGWMLGDNSNFRTSQKSLPFQIDLTLPENAPVEKIVLRSMPGSCPVIRLSAFSGEKELDVTIAKRENSISLEFPHPVAGKNLRLEGVTKQAFYRVGDFTPEFQKQIAGTPVTGTLKFYGKHYEMTPDNVDRESIARFLKKYPDYIMDHANEVSSNFYQARRNPARFRDDRLLKQAYIGPTYDRTKYEYETTLRNYWNHFYKLFGTELTVLEGGLPTMPYYYEWGVKYCTLEASNERPNAPNRILMLFCRSGSRQYNRPWGFYQTLYASGTYAWSLYSEKEALAHAKKIKAEFPGEDFGCSPSYTKRILYYAYYAGTNIQTFEAEPYGYLKHLKDGSWILTGHGRSVKDIGDWVVRPEGKRGEFYAPVLFLKDYYSANWEYQRGKVWNTWYLFPYEDSDYMYQHIIRTIDPLGGSFTHMQEHSPGMRNSKFGDIYDCFFANPPSGIITNAELGKYPVVFLMDSIAASPELSARLQKYVQDGGTLVINTAQMKLIPESFAGVKLEKEEVVSNDMKIRKLTLQGAEVVLKDSSGLPLVTRCRQGRGNVILTTPYYLLNSKDKKVCINLIPVLLEKIQNEVLPVKVSGDIQFFFNKMSGRNWKLILINNKGVWKPPMQTKEVFLPKYAKKVTLTLPAGAKAAEIRLKLPLTTEGNKVSLTVPPGEIAVVDLTDVDFVDSPISSEPIRRAPLSKRTEASNNPKVVFQSQAGENGKNTDTEKAGKSLFYNGKTAFTEFHFPVDQVPMPEGGYSCWVKPESVSGEQVVITNRLTRFEIINGRWNVYVNDGIRRWNIPGPKAEAGKWAHIAFTWKDSVARMYVNGKEPDGMPQIFQGDAIDGIRFGNQFDGTRGNVAGLYLGSHYYRRTSLFRGWIGSVYFYGKAPSDQEIAGMAAKTLQ